MVGIVCEDFKHTFGIITFGSEQCWRGSTQSCELMECQSHRGFVSIGADHFLYVRRISARTRSLIYRDASINKYPIRSRERHKQTWLRPG